MILTILAIILSFIFGILHHPHVNGLIFFYLYIKLMVILFHALHYRWNIVITANQVILIVQLIAENVTLTIHSFHCFLMILMDAYLNTVKPVHLILMDVVLCVSSLYFNKSNLNFNMLQAEYVFILHQVVFLTFFKLDNFHYQ